MIDTIKTEIDTIEIDRDRDGYDRDRYNRDREMTEMTERHLHDFQVARFKVLQVFQVLL